MERRCIIFRSGYILFFVLLSTANLSAQGRNLPIPGIIAQYFNLNRGGPELLDVEIFEHPKLGHTIRIKIAGRRNRSAQDLIYAFTAAAAVANLNGDIEMLWVEMDISFKEIETTQALARADCTIDAIIERNFDTNIWLKSCLQFP